MLKHFKNESQIKKKVSRMQEKEKVTCHNEILQQQTTSEKSRLRLSGYIPFMKYWTFEFCPHCCVKSWQMAKNYFMCSHWPWHFTTKLSTVCPSVKICEGVTKLLHSLGQNHSLWVHHELGQTAWRRYACGPGCYKHRSIKMTSKSINLQSMVSFDSIS